VHQQLWGYKVEEKNHLVVHKRKRFIIIVLEEKLGGIKCESGKVDVQWNNIKKCVLHTMSDSAGKLETARTPWITQEMTT
jgi:hypothetical protein